MLLQASEANPDFFRYILKPTFFAENNIYIQNNNMYKFFNMSMGNKNP